MESPVVFRGSLKKALLILLISVGFVALGAWATTERPVIGWVCIAFFGLGIPASLLMMLPNTTYLKLDADGIDIVSMSRHCDIAKKGKVIATSCCIAGVSRRWLIRGPNAAQDF